MEVSGYWVKNSLRAHTTDSKWAWPECTDASTALLVALRESVMSIICLTSKEVALATPSLIAKSSTSKAVARPAGALDDDTCTPNLQKCVAETAYIFLGGMTLASVTTTSVEGLEDAS